MSDTFTAPPPTPTFNLEALARQTYLTLPEAAAYLSFTPTEYRDPLKAFYCWVVRAGVPRCYVGRKLRFRRRDLDRAVTGGTR